MFGIYKFFSPPKNIPRDATGQQQLKYKRLTKNFQRISLLNFINLFYIYVAFFDSCYLRLLRFIFEKELVTQKFCFRPNSKQRGPVEFITSQTGPRSQFSFLDYFLIIRLKFLKNVSFTYSSEYNIREKRMYTSKNFCFLMCKIKVAKPFFVRFKFQRFHFILNRKFYTTLAMLINKITLQKKFQSFFSS